MEPEVYQRMAELEDQHWWFVGRRQIVAHAIRRLKPPDDCRILEIGCGTGGNLAMLQSFGSVTSIEPEPAARELARQKGAQDIQAGDLPNGLPQGLGRFDLIVLLDVLEHIDDDVASLNTLAGHLKPGGRLLLTVPAFPFLWSAHDVVHHHKRRYQRQKMKQRVTEAGYQINTLRYFNSLLFPPIALVRGIGKLLNATSSNDEKMPPKWLNELLSRLFASEKMLINGPIVAPFGVSLLCVAQKTNTV